MGPWEGGDWCAIKVCACCIWIHFKTKSPQGWIRRKVSTLLNLPCHDTWNVYLCSKRKHYRKELVNPIMRTEPYKVRVIELQYPRMWTRFPVSDTRVIIYGFQSEKMMSSELMFFFLILHWVLKEFNSRVVLYWAILQSNNIINHGYISGVGTTLMVKGIPVTQIFRKHITVRHGVPHSQSTLCIFSQLVIDEINNSIRKQSEPVHTPVNWLWNYISQLWQYFWMTMTLIS